MNTNTLWEDGKLEKSQHYSSQLPDNFSSIPHIPVKLEYDNGHKPFPASDVHKYSDISSQPPLQPSPNIVDQITFSKTSTLCK